MDNEEQADIEEVVPAATEEGTEETEPTQAVTEEPDPLTTELEKVQRKGRTKAEKLLYTKKRVDDQLKELGIEDEPLEDDDQPVTMGDLKRFQAQTATKTALQMADDVANETERELLKYHIDNTIKSTGNPQEDFELARTLVNAVKNKQITEEVLRKPEANTHSSSSGAPARQVKKEDELTVAELAFMGAPFNLSKDQIIAARPKE